MARLRDPASKGKRGTIVWLLREYDCTDIFGDLVTCLLEGSFEEVQHAHDILHAMDDCDVPTTEHHRIRDALKAGIKDAWRKPAVENVFELFEND